MDITITYHGYHRDKISLIRYHYNNICSFFCAAPWPGLKTEIAGPVPCPLVLHGTPRVRAGRTVPGGNGWPIDGANDQSAGIAEWKGTRKVQISGNGSRR